MKINIKGAKKSGDKAVGGGGRDKNGKTGTRKPVLGEKDLPNMEMAIVQIEPNLSDLSGSHGDNNSIDAVGSTTIIKEKKFERQILSKYTQACKSLANSHYTEALNIFELILSELLSRYGGKHERIGAALHNVSIASLRAGNVPDSMDAIEEAIKIRTMTLGRTDPKVTDSLIQYGLVLLQSRQYMDATKVFESALHMRKNESNITSDDKYIEIAKIYNNMGCVHFGNGELKQSKKHFDEALRNFSKVYGVWDKMSRLVGNDSVSGDSGFLAVAATLCNKAYIEMRKQNYRSAIVFLGQSLVIQKELLGFENKLVKNCLEHIAYCHIENDEHEKALKTYKEIWKNKQTSSSASTEQKIQTLRDMIYCEVCCDHNKEALEHLAVLEALYMNKGSDDKTMKCDVKNDDRDDQTEENRQYSEQLADVRKLMTEVNYQVFKNRSLVDAYQFTVGKILGTHLEETEERLKGWFPEEPEMTARISGHKIAHS